MRMNYLVLIFVPVTVLATDLFSPDGYRALTEDSRSRQVGELVTIVIMEASSAASNAGTSVSSSLDVGVSGSDTSRTESGSVRVGAGKSGEGSTQREGLLRGRITVPIVSIDPAGSLFLEGEQIIVINGEEQIIRISGYARVADIQPNNTIFSTQLAGSRIEYSGQGIADHAERKGVFTWLLAKLRII